jgi:hypothetical protein
MLLAVAVVVAMARLVEPQVQVVLAVAEQVLKIPLTELQVPQIQAAVVAVQV